MKTFPQRKVGGLHGDVCCSQMLLSSPSTTAGTRVGGSLPSFLRLLSWLNCSVNSVSDSSMVSVRGTESENLRLKFFILFIVACAARDGRALRARGQRG